MLQTPYYLIDKARLLPNMEKIAHLRETSGAKALLALKCFATWGVFDFMSDYMDGTTSSSLYEVKLGREKFPGETHAYSVAWADHEIDEVLANSDKVIFNTAQQLQRFEAQSAGHIRGLRVNPGVSTSDFDLADPSRPFSRLGEHAPEDIEPVAEMISGFMFHNNCENADFERFDAMLGMIEQRFGPLIRRMNWISLGGGIHFTGEGYPLEKLAERLKTLCRRERGAGLPGTRRGLDHQVDHAGGERAGHALQRQEPGHRRQLDRGAYAGSADLPRKRQDE